MHIRVVNEFGLLPTRNTMAMRSLFRMCIPWMICITVHIGYEPLANTLLLLCVLFVLLNISFLLVYDKARSLHDLLCKTRVVLDTD